MVMMRLTNERRALYIVLDCDNAICHITSLPLTFADAALVIAIINRRWDGMRSPPRVRRDN